MEFVKAVKALRDMKKSVRQTARELRCGEKRVRAAMVQREAIQRAAGSEAASTGDDGGQAEPPDRRRVRLF